MVKIISELDIQKSENRDFLRRFLKESWKETYPAQLGDNVTSAMIASLTDESLGGILPSNGEKVIVAIEGGSIVASCVYATRHGTSYIWGCYVLEGAQRSGIGRNMIELIKGDGSNQERLQIMVLHVSEAAVRFYEHLGFTPVENAKFELVPGHEETALTMEMKVGGYLRKSESTFEPPSHT